jgi:hypothetical protein
MKDTSLIEAVLAAAIALKDASLVIFRRGLLVEFKTEGLAPGLSVSMEGKHRSWQIGPFEGHHCHLDLAAVRTIVFDAEPVSCQGGRINYTVWFQGEGDCGNPYRSEGLFSVTLNRPYERDGSPRAEVIAPVFDLYERFRDEETVAASEAFLNARIVPGGAPSPG